MSKLEELPAKIDGLTAQVLQVRVEMGSEFSAVRREMQAMGDGIVGQLRGEMRASTDGLRSQLLDAIGEMHAIAMREIVDLGDRMDAGFVGMRAEVRAFREETLAGLQTIQDRLPPR